MFSSDWIRTLALGLILGLSALGAQARQAAAAPPPADAPPSASTAAPGAVSPLLILGPGDEVSMHVYGAPTMDGTMYVADDGTIPVNLVGAVHVAGLSPSEAADAVTEALEKGQYLVHPHITITIVKSRSQQVSVGGEVGHAGSYAVASNTTVLDLIAMAGGENLDGADTVLIYRKGPDGAIHSLPVRVQDAGTSQAAPEAARITLQGGDQLWVPRAPKFFISGQVKESGQFRLEAGMTVLEAIARAGGVTDMGSTRRVVIRRREGPDRYREIAAKLTDMVQPDDIITVRERIF
jgi:polysaccharide biosynthesis/export protein